LVFKSGFNWLFLLDNLQLSLHAVTQMIDEGAEEEKYEIKNLLSQKKRFMKKYTGFVFKAISATLTLRNIGEI